MHHMNLLFRPSPEVMCCISQLLGWCRGQHSTFRGEQGWRQWTTSSRVTSGGKGYRDMALSLLAEWRLTAGASAARSEDKQEYLLKQYCNNISIIYLKLILKHFMALYIHMLLVQSWLGTLKFRDSRNREKFKNSRKQWGTCF